MISDSDNDAKKLQSEIEKFLSMMQDTPGDTGWRVLIVDDEDDVRQFIRDTLELVDFKVHEAVDGRDALNLVKENEYRVVIADIIMPNIEGIELIMELRKLRPGIKILAISGGGRIRARDYLRTASHLGANSTLSKPFEPYELIQKVRHLV